MSMKLFAEKYRVKVRYTGSELIAPGRCGEIADDYGDGSLRLRLTAVPASSNRDRVLNQRAEQARLGGMVLTRKTAVKPSGCFVRIMTNTACSPSGWCSQSGDGLSI